MPNLSEVFNDKQYLAQNNYKLQHYRHRDEKIEVEEHFHDFYEIFFLFSSEFVEYSIDGRTFKLQANDILIINSETVHRAVSLGHNYDRLMLWIIPSYLKRISTPTTNLCRCFENIEATRNKNLLRLNPICAVKIRNIFLKIEAAYASDSYGGDLLMCSYLTELLVCINRYCRNPHNEIDESDITSNPLVDAALKYINENISEDLGLDTISKNLFVSKYHLLREFKKCIGYTVHQYILIKRLLLAENLLAEGKSTITEICFNCGFVSYTNFIRAFKKHYGISPGKFSKNIPSAATMFNR
ncbi:MAG: AraC family transcriptional regulator [Clostridiales Family XIII bacterium]|jgi:AraC-like DNA-binding protein|nr:AraC family transcriptional regulator [Clostridiales Family XIII bacterium]